MDRESMSYDVVIVGAGPAGLSAAIRLKQLNASLTVCVLEKGASVGAHILSGAVIEPRALDEFLPDWRDHAANFATAVEHDAFYWLTSKRAFKLPTPRPMRNEGNYIVSLGNLCRWLATVAERLGVEIYPGFAGAEVLFDEQGSVIGVATGDVGINARGEQTAQYQRGMALLGKQTIFAEGCRGSLSELVMKHFDLRKDVCPQTYGLGLKELWEVDSPQYKSGSAWHSVGWPLDKKTYGGSFVYHLPHNRVYIGYVVGLDYQNPYLSPFHEFQRFKQHPFIKSLLQGGKRISYGARSLNEGGLQSLPKLTFPGGCLIGCAAGTLNVPKIKGTHTAMKSALCAAEAIVMCLEKDEREATEYPVRLKASWLYQELKAVRNIRPAFRYGLVPGMLHAALDTYIFRGLVPYTFKTKEPDHAALRPAEAAVKIDYPKPDNVLTFDRLSSVYLTNTYHSEDQPCHLVLKNKSLAIDNNYKLYASPETRYCPAGVYEIVYNENMDARLQINAQNCIHCKACDIKDPKQNIQWMPPEGGGGPNYENM